MDKEGSISNCRADSNEYTEDYAHFCALGPNSVKAGSFQGQSVSILGEKDIRFTRNKANNVVYAVVLGLPTAPVVVKAMGSAAATQPGRIARVEVLGTNERVRWKQHGDGLHLELPTGYRPKADYAVAFKVSLD